MLPPFSLTPRERKVLELLATGHTYESMARKLQVSRSTIQTILEHTYRKMGVNSGPQAVHVGHLTGVLGRFPRTQQ